MADTAIEWADKVWNPVTGCDRISPGCDNCYALAMAKRLKAMGNPKYQGDGDPRTSGPGFAVTTHPDALTIPLRRRKPATFFVNSMSDLFHARVPREFIAQVFGVMAVTPQHTYQVLTKRAGRMQRLLASEEFRAEVIAGADGAYDAAARVSERTLLRLLPCNLSPVPWPLPNVHLGVSAENQKQAEIRIPDLLATPLAVRWVSAEPLLGPLDLHRYLGHFWKCAGCGKVIGQHTGSPNCFECGTRNWPLPLLCLDWVVAGGESGPGARPMHPAWVRSLRDQCQEAGVPFLFKQWGEYRWITGDRYDEGSQCWVDDGIRPQRVGKKAAGRELDGQLWDQYPEAVTSRPPSYAACTVDVPHGMSECNGTHLTLSDT